jgi:RNA-directed DNA polymerase
VVVLCGSQQQAEQVKARLVEWLAPRGLAFNEDKTRIVHLGEGFDFLGFNVRRYPNRKLLIKPSKAAVRRLRERLAAETRRLRGGNAMAVIAALNPVIRGWAAYYRSVVSTRTFSALDDYLWKLTYKWATWSHANKPKHWIVGRYFGKFSKFRNDHWVFGDRDSGAHLVKFSWTGIERHVPVKGGASPDDPALASYWAERRRRVKPPLDRYTLRLLTRQDGLCPLCGEPLLTADQPPQSPEQWERWWLQVTRKAIAASYLAHHGRPGPPDGAQTRLVHASCQRGLQARQRGKPAPQPATPSRLA